MKLTRQQRADFFKGEFPRITYPGAKPCPAVKGEVYRLSKLKQLVVVGIRRSRKGDWVVDYALAEAERPLYLAPTPKARFKKDKHGRWVIDDKGWSEEEARGYTQSRSRSLDPTAECIDLDTLRDQRHDAEARHERYELERAGKLLRTCEDLKAAIDDMDPELRRTVSRDVWVLKGRISALERKLRGKAAA